MAQTNREYAENNKAFRQACEEAGIEPTPRQAAKYRRGYGQAAQSISKRSSLKVRGNGLIALIAGLL